MGPHDQTKEATVVLWRQEFGLTCFPTYRQHSPAFSQTLIYCSIIAASGKAPKMLHSVKT